MRVEAKVVGSGDGKLGRIHSAHLTGSNTNHPVLMGQNDSIGFHMLANPPGKVQRPTLCGCRPAAGHHLAVLDPHTAHNEAAAIATRNEVKALLKTVFKLE